MEYIIQVIAQAPLVAVFAYMWWNTRKELLAENKRLLQVIEKKDSVIEDFTNVIGKLSLTLELIKDRLR